LVLPYANAEAMNLHLEAQGSADHVMERKFILQPRAQLLKRAVFATGLALIASQGLAQRPADSPFFGLSGYWSGGGMIAMTNGTTERIRCKCRKLNRQST